LSAVTLKKGWETLKSVVGAVSCSRRLSAYFVFQTIVHSYHFARGLQSMTGELLGKPARLSALMDLSSQFYTIFPHDFGRGMYDFYHMLQC
jgi:hypothetical protein